MSAEVGQPPVDVAAEPAPVEEQSSGLDTKAVSGAIKKVDKKGLLSKLKAICKKVLPKKKAPVEVTETTTEEPAAEAAVPAEAAPVAAPTTTAAA